jgi:activator of HSP90 ATPase
MFDPIRQEQVFPASPQAVYAALTDDATFGSMTGAPASIGAAGSEISLFGGEIVGRNIECQPGVRLVQAWRVKDWPAGVHSIVHFELIPDGDGTRVTLEQAAFPEDSRSHLDAGWLPMYWQPMHELLG